MSDSEVVLVDLVSSAEKRVTLRQAAEMAELHIEDVEWALEEFGLCVTDHYRIIDTE